jgi:hypothetical protein
MLKQKEKMHSEKSSRVHWQWYKSIFENTTFNYYLTFFTIIPLLITLFGDFPNALHFEFCNYNIQITKSIMFALLVSSAILFIVNYYLYFLFCPRFIKDYGSYKDYKSFEHSPRWLVWLSESLILRNIDNSHFIDRMLEKKYLTEITAAESKIPADKLTDIDVKSNQTTLNFKYNNKFYSLALPILKDSAIDKDATGIAESEIFWEIFEVYASSWKLIRYLMIGIIVLCAILFSLSLFILIIFVFELAFMGKAYQAIRCKC